MTVEHILNKMIEKIEWASINTIFIDKEKNASSHNIDESKNN